MGEFKTYQSFDDIRRPHFIEKTIEVGNGDRAKAWGAALESQVENTDIALLLGHRGIHITYTDGRYQIETYLSENTVRIDTKGGLFGFQAQVVRGRLLQTSACLVQSDGIEFQRSPVLPRYGRLYALALSYFSRLGITINGERHIWPPQHVKSNIPNPNYISFYKALSEGKTPEEAAANAPTGKVSIRHGFTQIHVLSPIPHFNLSASGQSVESYFLQPGLQTKTAMLAYGI